MNLNNNRIVTINRWISITPQLIKGPSTPKLTYHFLKRAQFSQNFDSNITTQRFVNTKKLTFEIDDLRK